MKLESTPPFLSLQTPEGDQIRRSILTAGARLPSSSQILERMNRLLGNPDASVDEICDVIRLDAAIALRVMRLANHAQFVRNEPFSNLESAIEWVGITHIYQMLAATVSARLFCEHLPAYGLASELVWKNSVATGTAMSLLAEAAKEDKRRAYSLGLFRPVGRLVLQKIARERGLKVDQEHRSRTREVLAWERDRFGIDNAGAVSVLFDQWKLNTALGSSILLHFDPLSAPDAPHAALAALLHVASWMAQQAGHGLAVEQDAWNICPDMIRLAHLPRFNMDSYVARTLEITTRLTVNPMSN
jgi:HD-like signal output (HDOD) protein